MIKVRSPRHLIGDSLSLLPFLLELSYQNDIEICVTGVFSEAVKPLIAHLPITFSPEPCAKSDYATNVQDAFNLCHGPRRDLHMAQSYFAMNDMPVPELPIRLDLIESYQCPAPGTVIVAPFSRSDIGHNKLWYENRWAEVITALIRDGETVSVIGGDEDDCSPYEAAGATAIKGYSLPNVLSLLWQTDLLLSIDNGISHLAHYGAVDRHVLLYPTCLSPNWARNPGATHVTGHPRDISPRQVIDAATAILGRA